MSDTLVAGHALGLLAAAHTLLDDLLTVDRTGDTDDEVLAVLRETERLRRRLDAVDYRGIHEAERRGLPHAHGCKTTGRLLEQMLRVNSTTAHDRVKAAAAAGPRTGLTGEALGPVFPHVAAGQAQGVV
ncbi:DUF222 domain-containing protein, partial [uncultured Jatrophihabitans sp.]|uniref:DUF222 domain-containing protein n=1 Tax=uncultured Jatrophihabitans sp. TaxID=1610747 RepID=UPI0035C9AE04